MKIYLAGKISHVEGLWSGWRDCILPRQQWVSDDYCGYSWPACLSGAVRIQRWVTSRDSFESELVTAYVLDYVGPFGTTYRGSSLDSDEDGCVHRMPVDHGGECWDVFQMCKDAIDRCDIFFAWLDDLTAHGTFVEIGYAHARGKRVWIAGPRHIQELWFVYRYADKLLCNTTPSEALRQFLDEAYPHESLLLLQSPIERQFAEAWLRVGGNDDLVLHPQHQVGQYRVDFAHLSTKTAIELDGYQYHSSASDIARDRQRERYLTTQGWHVIRFGGQEIHHNADKCVREVISMLRARLEAA